MAQDVKGGAKEGAGEVKGETLANLFNLSTIHLGKLAAQGVVLRKGHDRFALWDSVRGYIKHLQGRIRERHTASHTKGLAEERIRKTREEADRVAMDNERTRERTVSVDEIIAAFGRCFESARERILAAEGLDDDEKDAVLADLRGILDRERLHHARTSNGTPRSTGAAELTPTDELP